MTGPRQRGTIAHKAFRAYFKARREGQSEASREASVRAVVDAAEGEIDDFEMARLRPLLVGHATWWDLIGCDVLEVEAQFRLPLADPRTGRVASGYQLGGQRDGKLLLHATNSVVVLEHKTTTARTGVGSAYRAKLALDGQVSQYLLARDADYVLYDIVGVPQLEPLQATPLERRRYRRDGGLIAAQRADGETAAAYEARCAAAIAADPRAYYAQVPVGRTRAELDDYAADTWDTAAALDRAARTGRAPKHRGACFKFGGACDFHDVCTGRVALTNAARFRRAAQAHEELDGEWSERRDAW